MNLNPNSSNEEWNNVQTSTLNVSDSTNSLFSTLKQSDVKMNSLVSRFVEKRKMSFSFFFNYYYYC
jgi:hypothetical protein